MIEHDVIAQATPMPILVAPQAVLRQKTRLVRPEDMDGLRTIIPACSRPYQAPGIGLAAPQVGLGMRFAIVDVSDKDGPRNPIVLINPEVIAETDSMAAREEGCLSLPNQYAEVVRPEAVRVRYQDMEGKVQELEADDLLATCLQHEIDHLEGILFVDHLSTLKRNMIMRRLAKEQRQKH
ncbi:peptide deformylase [Komagataeibacter rhaeticus]|nr:peptide deformylase [Komagataeibacter rhaeticus]